MEQALHCARHKAFRQHAVLRTRCDFFIPGQRLFCDLGHCTRLISDALLTTGQIHIFGQAAALLRPPWEGNDQWWEPWQHECC